MNGYTHRWRLNAVLLVSMMLLTTSGPVVARDNQAELQTVGWANPCLLYGTVETPRQDARLFAIDLVGNTTQLLGEALPKAHVSGLAVHPDTGELVALVRNQTRQKVTKLARVDAATGAMTLIGETEMDFGEGLSYRPTDATLWAWWREHGLVRIDPETAEVELVLAGDLAVSALAWDPTGTTLYQPERCWNGYTLLFRGLEVRLIDMSGQLAHAWTLETDVTRCGTDRARLLPNGNVLVSRGGMHYTDL